MRVALRLCPPADETATVALSVEDAVLRVSFGEDGGTEERHDFDACLGSTASQADLCSALEVWLLEPLLDGANVTLVCLGGPASGKQHSVLGTPTAPGLVGLVGRALF